MLSQIEMKIVFVANTLIYPERSHSKDLRELTVKPIQPFLLGPVGMTVRIPSSTYHSQCPMPLDIFKRG